MGGGGSEKGVGIGRMGGGTSERRQRGLGMRE